MGMRQTPLMMKGLQGDRIGLSGRLHKQSRFLITQDLDFSDTRKFAPGTHCGILLVRLREPSAQALFDKISAVVGELAGWHGCFVVLTEHKLRVKCP